MADQFDTKLRSQQQWSWLVAIDLFLAGLGGGLFLLFQIFKLSPSVALLSLGLVVLGGLVLLAELGRPLRAWRAVCKPRTSWISRGVIFVFVFIVTASLSIAPAFSDLPWLAEETLAARLLSGIASLSAFVVAIYPGFVLSASPAIPFWHSPLFPLLFLSYSVMGASGILLLGSPLGALNPEPRGVNALAALMTGITLIMVAIYLAVLKGSGLAGREALRLLTRGTLGWTFGAGVILVGMVLPLLVFTWMPSAGVLAGGCMLVGGLLFRYCVLKAAVYVPFPLE